MTEEQASRKASAQVREFPEAMEMMARIRAAMAARLFETDVGQSEVREGLYLRVATLDAMMKEMQGLMADAAGDKAIQVYVEELVTGKSP